MRSKRYLIRVVLAVIFAAGLAGCTEDVEEAQTRVLHDKSTEVAEVTETTVSQTPATEPDAKAIQPATKTTADKAKATELVKQKTTENKPNRLQIQLWCNEIRRDRDVQEERSPERNLGRKSSNNKRADRLQKHADQSRQVFRCSG